VLCLGWAGDRRHTVVCGLCGSEGGSVNVSNWLKPKPNSTQVAQVTLLMTKAQNSRTGIDRIQGCIKGGHLPTDSHRITAKIPFAFINTPSARVVNNDCSRTKVLALGLLAAEFIVALFRCKLRVSVWISGRHQPGLQCCDEVSMCVCVCVRVRVCVGVNWISSGTKRERV
jgi:hypothetical protein